MRDPDDKSLDVELRKRPMSDADKKALLERREELSAAAERVNGAAPKWTRAKPRRKRFLSWLLAAALAAAVLYAAFAPHAARFCSFARFR